MIRSTNSRQMLRTLALAFGTALTVAACGGSDSTGPDQSAQLRVVNSAEHTIFFVFTRDCGTSTWGDDLLGAHVLSVGNAQTFDVAPGCQDIMVETNPDLFGQVVWASVSLEAGKTDTLTLQQWQYTQ